MRSLPCATLALVLLCTQAHASTCIASYYGSESGKRTASGERFNPRAFTAAHRTLPFGSRVRVTFAGRSVIVRINDRGPAAYTRRCIDLSAAAAREIGLQRAGIGRVFIQKLR